MLGRRADAWRRRSRWRATRWTATSRLADGLLARAPAGAVACRAGCDHCCYQSVGVTPPEALAIFDHLSRTLSDTDAGARRGARRRGTARARAGCRRAERFSPDHPCPFLDGRAGAARSTRSVRSSCRGMNSLDADECEKRLRDPAARAAFLAERAGGHSFMEPIRAFHAVSAGIQLGLAELLRPRHARPGPDRRDGPAAERRRVDPSQVDRRRHRRSSRRAPTTTIRRCAAQRRRSSRPSVSRARPISAGRTVIFVTSPGLVIPPEEPVPSN